MVFTYLFMAFCFTANVFSYGTQDMFVKYKQKYNKTYTSKQEENYRYQIFEKNVIFITKHNEVQNDFKFIINEFTDLDYSEFQSVYLPNMYTIDIGKSNCKIMKPSKTNTVPDSIDWVKNGKVTSVKNQGTCGSCWAFSTAGSIESAYAIKNNKLVDLSEQQLMDCSKDYGNDSCEGGMMDNAYNYIIDSKRGLCSNSEYPYLKKNENICKTCNKTYGRVKSCIDIPSGNNILLKEAVSKTPVSIAIDATNIVFQFYHNGTITNKRCGTDLNHGVLIVGYGTENGIDYWKIKNSWGPNWGDNGYVKIQRSNKENDIGICGVSSKASYPILV